MKRAVLAGLLAFATPALAQQSPVLQPTRDVDITYRVPLPGAADSYVLQRLRWSAANHEQRVDVLPASGNWMVMDLAAHRMTLVHDASREVVDQPSPPTADQSGVDFTRVETASVAGLPCTQWRTVDTRGQATLACYTADGVLLRATSGSRTLMEAVHVTYEAQPGSLFQPPAGYTHQRTHG